MSNGEAKYHFVNKAGQRFAATGWVSEHNMTLRIKDGKKMDHSHDRARRTKRLQGGDGRVANRGQE